ncbi:MAG: lipopolysaccharide biosynthesis protein [Erythrobacter sp.]
MATLAKGGRTNALGFVIRLIARVPFLFIGYRLYGVEEMGRFASAFVIIEILALLCALGEKRGLAQRLTEGAEEHGPDSERIKTNLVFDGMLGSLLVTGVVSALLLAFPAVMFPNGTNSPLDIWMIAALPGYALTEILLAAQAYRYDIATTVRARAIVEPWAISIAAGAFLLVPGIGDGGLALAFIISIYAGLATAAWSFARTYGGPRGWRPNPAHQYRLITRALPLVGADVIERGTRLLDVIILGFFVSPVTVGTYFFAQQIASLPQKLKTSFEPILSPVITKNLKSGNMAAIAQQVRQVGFWIIALQLGIALMLAIPGEAVMGLGGPEVVGGTGALTLLLAAEVVASMAVVSEGVLVYIARKRNLAISIGVITLQAVLTVGLILLAKAYGLNEGFQAASAAGALFVALGLSSLVKAIVLKTLLKAPVSNWRWALVWAAGPAVIVGFLATQLPEWAELLIGGPAILAVYLWVIWKRGFGEEDKVLFRKNVAPVPAEQATGKA